MYMPIPQKNLVNGDYSTYDKKWLWAWMPANPSDINSKSEVLVVAGDTNYQAAGDSVKASLASDQERQKINDISHKRDHKEASNFIGEAIAEGAIVSGMAGLITSALIAAHEKQKNKLNESNEPTTHRLSRRTFFKVAGGGAVAALAMGSGRAGAIFGSAVAPNATLQEISDKIVDVTDTLDFFPKHWLNGRTAILIAKTNAVVEQGLTPPNAKAAVVMGNGHNFEGREMIDDKGKRMKAIYDYAEEVVSFYRKVLKEFPSIDPNKAIDQILDMFCQTDMIVVADPNTQEGTDPQKTIDASMRYIGSLAAPEVMEAVAPLRIHRGDDEDDANALVSKPVSEPRPLAEPTMPANLPPVIIPKPPR
jgi:hypothetical protein